MGGADATEVNATPLGGGEGWLIAEILDLRNVVSRTQQQQEQQQQQHQQELGAINMALSALRDESKDMRGQLQRMRVLVQNTTHPQIPRTTHAAREYSSATPGWEERCDDALALVDQQLRLRLLRFDEALEAMRENWEEVEKSREMLEELSQDSLSDCEISKSDTSAKEGGERGGDGNGCNPKKVTFGVKQKDSSSTYTSSSTAAAPGICGVGGKEEEEEEGSMLGLGRGRSGGMEGVGALTVREAGTYTAGGGLGWAGGFRQGDGVDACVEALLRLEKEVARGFKESGAMEERLDLLHQRLADREREFQGLPHPHFSIFFFRVLLNPTPGGLKKLNRFEILWPKMWNF